MDIQLKVAVEKLLLRFEESGVNPTGKSNIIVSLTSFPPRMDYAHFALFSLLNQTMKPEMVILWLAEEEFPDKEKSLPQKILQLQKNGVTIFWTKNIGSFKKLVPALKKFGNKIIVTADDDIFYPPEWLETLYKEYQNSSDDGDDYIFAHRIHGITRAQDGTILPYLEWYYSINTNTASYLNFATTGAGALFPPNCLHSDVFKEDIFMQLAPKADDIFFWAMAVLKGTKIKGVTNSPLREILELDIPGPKLYQTNMFGGNDQQLQNILTHYPQIYDFIRNQDVTEQSKALDLQRLSFDSGAYWNQRYETKGNSGAGSYNHLRDFKASVINTFIAENNICSVIDFGVGDGSLLSQLSIPQYTGIDVSAYIIEQLKEKFSLDTGKKFFTTQEYEHQTAEVSMSIDVIFHLVEDEVFHAYMERLFDAAIRNVIIYSSNIENFYEEVLHVKHRKFSKWVAVHRPDWACSNYIQNDYAVTQSNNHDVANESFCDFYIYAKK